MKCNPTTRTAPLARPELSDELKVPADQGECLVVPEAHRLSEAVEYNRNLFTQYQFNVAGMAYAEVRKLVREGISRDEASTERPFIATGHQPDFFHAGVWAKHVVAQRLADATGGTAFDLIVDHDAPKQTTIAVPTVNDGLAQIINVPYADAQSELPFEFLTRSGDQQTQRLIEQVREAAGDRYDTSLLPEYFSAYQETGDGDWVDQALAARKAVESNLGIRLLQRRTSRNWYSPFLAELLLSAEQFANAYNQVLAEEHPADDAHSTDRSVANLERINGAIELPLWINHPGQPRHRLFVAKENGSTQVLAESRQVATFEDSTLNDWAAFSAALAQMEHWVIRPKALILTMWARLFWADVFIHGIGGAKYDRLTDRLIRSVFGVEPPVMACVSATLRLPLPRTDTTVAEIEAATRSLRDVAFNPHRYITHEQMAAIQLQKEDLIAESKRLRNQDRSNRPERAKIFNQIRTLNREAIGLQPNRRAELRQHLERIKRAITADETANCRDYFFAMHDRSDLQRLLENLPSVQQMQA